MNLVFIMYTAIALPIWIPFEDSTSIEFLVIDTIIDVFFMCDILINFNTAYENEDGELVTNWKTLAKNYIRHWFILDLVSSVPLTLIGYYTYDSQA